MAQVVQKSRAKSQFRPTGQGTAAYGVVTIVTRKRKGIHQRNVGEDETQF